MVSTGSEDAVLGAALYGEQIAGVYDDWFSLPGGRPESAAAVDFLGTRAGHGPTLELGVGTGRMALPLAARGTTVVGIDASPRMLAQLAEKPGGKDLEVVVGDFADVTAPGGPFSLVYVVFNTFFMLRDQETQLRCFANVAGALRPGGLFVLEAFVPDQTRYHRGQDVLVDSLAEDAVRLTLAIHDPVEQRVQARHLALGPEGMRTYPIELRYAWPSELDLMGRLAGLELTERWGGWSGQPFTAASPTHVSVWRKPDPRR